MAVYWDMDPVQLFEEEIDHELHLRGVFSLTTSRQKAQCLREFLRCEAAGTSTLSPSRASAHDATVELSICANIIGDVCRMLEGSELGDYIFPQCRSRLIHAIERIKRAKPEAPEDQVMAYDLIAAAETRLADIPSQRAKPGRSPPNKVVTTRSPLADVIEQIGGVQSTSGGARPRHSEVQRARMSDLNPSVPEFEPGAGNQQQFSEAAAIVSRENLDLVGRIFDNTSEADAGVPGGAEGICASEPSLSLGRPTASGLVREDVRTEWSRRTTETMRIGRESSATSHEVPSAMPHTEQRSHNGKKDEQFDNRDERHGGLNAQFAQLFPGDRPTPAACANRSRNHERDGQTTRQYEYDQQTRFARQQEDEQRARLVRQREDEQRARADRQHQEETRARFARQQEDEQRARVARQYEDDQRVRAARQDEEEQRARAARRYEEEQHERRERQYRETRDVPLAFARPDDFGSRQQFVGRDDRDAPRVRDNPFWRVERDEPGARRHSVGSQGDRGFQPARRDGRKTVPIHQWRISFSGDGNGLSLHDFLSDLRMLQRSEGVNDAELYASVVHLFAGRARLWYRSWYDTFGCWDELLDALKREFLPPKYDYRLLASISNRRQKQSETFAEYLTIMQSQFNHLAIRVDERHKLGIIEENMLPKYAVAVSTIEIHSLTQLSNICRRIDFACSKRDVGSLFEEKPHVARGVHHNRQRDVHEMEASANEGPGAASELGVGEAECGHPTHPGDSEVCAVQRAPKPVTMNRGEPRKCFNCMAEGHNFAECKQTRNGVFCYGCGSRNVTLFNCKDCSKNGKNGSGRDNASNQQQQ